MAKYIIEHFVEYYGSACSCCDPTPFDCYRVKDVETGKYFGCVDEHYGFIALQYPCKEDALEAILGKLGVCVEYAYEDEDEVE